MLQYSAILHNAIQYHVLLLDYYHIVRLLASVLSSMIHYAFLYYNVIKHHNT